MSQANKENWIDKIMIATPMLPLHKKTWMLFFTSLDNFCRRTEIHDMQQFSLRHDGPRRIWHELHTFHERNVGGQRLFVRGGLIALALYRSRT